MPIFSQLKICTKKGLKNLEFIRFFQAFNFFQPILLIIHFFAKIVSIYYIFSKNSLILCCNILLHCNILIHTYKSSAGIFFIIRYSLGREIFKISAVFEILLSVFRNVSITRCFSSSSTIESSPSSVGSTEVTRSA